MEATLSLSDAARGTAGTLLLTILAVEFGGWYMLRVVGRRVELTGFQRAFARAGHAHAGVLVILSLVVQLYADAAAGQGALASVSRSAVPLAAILMPAGFFLGSAGRGRSSPNPLVVLVYAGAVSLGIGVAALGVAFITG